MQIKTIAMMVVAGCAIGILTGCGVPQEDVDAMLAQKDAERATAENALNVKLDEQISLYESEKAKASTLNTQLKEASARLDEYKKENSELKSTVADQNSTISRLESSVASAKSSLASAQQQVAEADAACSEMEMEKQEVQRRFDALRANILELNQKKPDDLGIQLEGIVGGMDMSGLDMPEADVPSDSGSSLKGMFEDMK